MSGAGSSPQHVEIGTRRVRLTNLDKVLYPADGTTKAEVVRWYADAAPALAPYACDRPVTRKRWPDGVAAASFFEKNLPAGTPEWIARVHAPPHRPRHHLPADPRRAHRRARDPRVVRPVRRARAARAAVAGGRGRAAAARPGRDRPRPRARVPGSTSAAPWRGRSATACRTPTWSRSPSRAGRRGCSSTPRCAGAASRGPRPRSPRSTSSSSPRRSRATCPTWSCGA